jgi:hypothetical protein
MVFFTLLGGWLRFDKMQCILGDEEFSILLKQSTMKNKLINHALSLCEQSMLLATQTTHLHCPSKWIACIFQIANEAIARSWIIKKLLQYPPSYSCLSVSCPIVETNHLPMKNYYKTILHHELGEIQTKALLTT